MTGAKLILPKRDHPGEARPAGFRLLWLSAFLFFTLSHGTAEEVLTLPRGER